ncbi:hypothetical protein MIMGU_mgv1a0266341mg, partial [Erythranthe guttata]
MIPSSTPSSPLQTTSSPTSWFSGI